MSINWNAFLSDDGYTLHNDQWSDISPAANATLPMPAPNPPRPTTSAIEDANNFNSLLDGGVAGPYVDESLFDNQDFFLGDLELLQPFGHLIAGGGSTSESSPEPLLNMSPIEQTTTRELPQIKPPTSSRPKPSPPTQRLPPPRAKTFPNPSYESMFPNNLEPGFVEDLTFPGGPGTIATTKPPSDPIPNPPAPVPATTVKRSKADSDILSACWTSPLCPNHGLNGEIPDAANCGGGCAPFLFASRDTLPTPSGLQFPAAIQDVIAEDGVVEIQPRSRKRTESEASSNEPQGRQFPNKNIVETKPKPRIEPPKSSTSPEAIPIKEEPKPKPRRRLPHNQVERKYRESLNTQLDSLLRVVPSLQQNQLPCDGADIEDLPAPTKPSKAIILASATAYIKQMEKDKKSLADENALLRQRVKTLQALIKCDDCTLMQYVMDLKINPQA